MNYNTDTITTLAKPVYYPAGHDNTDLGPFVEGTIRNEVQA